MDFRGGRAVAFLISPLMCEKWAFRYFWPILPALCVIPNREERRFQATKRDVAKALLLFRRALSPRSSKRERRARMGSLSSTARSGLKRLDDILPTIGAVADVADQNILVTAGERYSVLRRVSPRFLAAFRF